MNESKQQRVTDEWLRKHPPAVVMPRLEKGLNKRDKRMGFTTYMQMGRA